MTSFDKDTSKQQQTKPTTQIPLRTKDTNMPGNKSGGFNKPMDPSRKQQQSTGNPQQNPNQGGQKGQFGGRDDKGGKKW